MYVYVLINIYILLYYQELIAVERKAMYYATTLPPLVKQNNWDRSSRCIYSLNLVRIFWKAM